MISLLVVADGPRDEATVPHMVEKILGSPIHTQFEPWPHLHGSGKGYERKLRFAVLQAWDAKAAGLVAVVDQDKAKHGGRLKALRGARC
jgi:hypothetical protein